VAKTGNELTEALDSYTVPTSGPTWKRAAVENNFIDIASKLEPRYRRVDILNIHTVTSCFSDTWVLC
jgi:hypothetical protein